MSYLSVTVDLVGGYAADFTHTWSEMRRTGSGGATSVLGNWLALARRAGQDVQLAPGQPAGPQPAHGLGAERCGADLEKKAREVIEKRSVAPILQSALARTHLVDRNG